MKLLENIDKGDSVRFREEIWYVKEKDHYDVTAIYHETQWTLTNQKKDIAYLLRAEEKQNDKWEDFWIVTKEIPFSEVEFANADKSWKTLDPNEIPDDAPRTARYGERAFMFHAKNIGKAKNDAGIETEKITWDYLDISTKYNLATELWEEDGKLYPEAYSGEKTERSEFEVIPYPPLRRVFPNHGALISVSVIMGIIGFIWLFVGPFDYFLSWSIPFMLVVMLMCRHIPLTWLISLCVSVVCVIIVLKFPDTFWTYGIVVLWGVLFVLRWAVGTLKRMENESLGFLAWSGVMPAMWIRSFHSYLSYSPSPHEFYQLAAACVLPLIVSLTCFIIIRMTEALWLNKS